MNDSPLDSVILLKEYKADSNSLIVNKIEYLNSSDGQVWINLLTAFYDNYKYLYYEDVINKTLKKIDFICDSEMLEHRN